MNDAELVRSVSSDILREFQATVSEHACFLALNAANEVMGTRQHFPAAFITANPGIFVGVDWVHPAQLRAFLRDRGMLPTSTRPVKSETSEPSLRVKSEPRSAPDVIDLCTPPRPTTKTRISIPADYMELSSDDEIEVEAALMTSAASSDPPVPSGSLPERDSDSDDDFLCSSHEGGAAAADEIDELSDSGLLQLSDTVWCDTDIVSKVINGPTNINRQTKVERVEYLDDIPSNFPVPRVPTAFILDLRDPKFNFVNKDNEPIRADTLILDKNQESWKTTSGGGDSMPTCALFNGEPIQCRRSRHYCNGCFRCSELDPALVNVTRYELDPTSRAQVIAAEVETRMTEGNPPAKIAATFYRSVTKRKCKGMDEIGAPCEGHPIMRRRKNGENYNGKSFFIGCSEWTPTWRSHSSDVIPPNVDETLLAQLFLPGAAFSSLTDTAPCSRIISPRTGLREKFCAHTHLRKGQTVRAPMQAIGCLPADNQISRGAGAANFGAENLSVLGRAEYPQAPQGSDADAYGSCDLEAFMVPFAGISEIADIYTTLCILRTSPSAALSGFIAAECI
ncbi:hypothetical protein MSAN_00592900 [Mycena sanguinolenta]|uniref:Uncharacterized protein n=1 Tax=Mycena sanguinolenta TaxID=230812 RepID=A0A8H7DHX3_9AGAR|nr:hypothetical protein MSAN_00592900 [Mycena sanguinolenta]